MATPKWTEAEWRLREEIAEVLERWEKRRPGLVNADHILDAIQRAGWTLVHPTASDDC